MSLPLTPLEHADGYPRLEDLGLVGDGATAALVCRDGSIPWLCVPRFDSEPLFCSLLDRGRGGRFLVAPEGVVESRQRYDGDTAVLVTDLRTRDGGLVRLTDAMLLRGGADLEEELPADRGELLRHVEVLEGPVRLRVEVEPRGGAEAVPAADGLELRCAGRADLELALASDRPLDGLRTTLELQPGERAWFLLRWGGQPRRRLPEVSRLLDETRAAWRRWLQAFTYRGLEEELVRRSAITLKLLDHFESGAIVAAPTSSLPERIGGERNWDYRYTWIRDAAFSVYALRRIGLGAEAWSFLTWVLRAIDREDRPRVLYDLDASAPDPERVDEELEGYRGSRPVRWGNAAAEQRQHDVFGEIVDCAYQWSHWGGDLDEHVWTLVRGCIEGAASEWREPDCGIWEVRSSARVFTYSAAMCHVALDRGARLVERLGVPGDAARWRRGADEIARAILEEGWSESLGAITENLGDGDGALDASVLTLPLRRVLPATHPRMRATTERIAERLGAGDGLLYRYLPDESPDGLEGHEGAFLLCSFWLVDNLAYQDRLDEAGELFASLCARAGPLGLLPEQIDPGTGAFLGNYPQAFSHVGVISSAVNLTRRTGGGAAPPGPG